MMKTVLKYSLAVPVLVALSLAAVVVLQDVQQPVEAFPDNIHPWVTASKVYVVHIASGDDKSSYERHSALMGVQHAKAFQDSGKKVIIFLDVNGVKLVDDAHPKLLSPHYDILEQFIVDGGRIIACQHCLGMHDIEDMMDGVEVDNHPTMPKLQSIVRSASVVLDY